jgi:uncharacterized secreted protein with C-terminal beta-propeller domain
MKKKVLGIITTLVVVIASLAACSTSPTPTSTTATWETHTYDNKEVGFALSFATTANWQWKGSIIEGRIGG